MPPTTRHRVRCAAVVLGLIPAGCGGGVTTEPTATECEAERRRLQAAVDAFTSSEQVVPLDGEQLIEQGFFSGRPAWHRYTEATGVVALAACADPSD